MVMYGGLGGAKTSTNTVVGPQNGEKLEAGLLRGSRDGKLSGFLHIGNGDDRDTATIDAGTTEGFSQVLTGSVASFVFAINKAKRKEAEILLVNASKLFKKGKQRIICQMKV